MSSGFKGSPFTYSSISESRMLLATPGLLYASATALTQLESSSGCPASHQSPSLAHPGPSFALSWGFLKPLAPRHLHFVLGMAKDSYASLQWFCNSPNLEQHRSTESDISEPAQGKAHLFLEPPKQHPWHRNSREHWCLFHKLP